MQELKATILFYWFQQSANLFAQFRIVSVSVCGDCVVDCGFQHFFFTTFQTQGAAAVARMVAAIDCFSFCHDESLHFLV